MRVHVMWDADGLDGGSGSSDILGVSFSGFTLLSFPVGLFLFGLRFLDLVGTSHTPFGRVHTIEAALAASAAGLKTVTLEKGQQR